MRFVRAGDGTRTRGHKLGRLVLYQLSYSRDAYKKPAGPHRSKAPPAVVGEGFEPSKAVAGRFTVCSRWPLGYPTALGEQVPNEPRILSGHGAEINRTQADGGNRTPNRLITNQVLCQLSYVSVT